MPEQVTATVRRFNDHDKDNGTWCPWSFALVSDTYPDRDTCPAGCSASRIDTLDADPDDLVEVYCGSTTPTRLCGFHNSRVTDYSKFPRKVTA